DVEPYYFGVAVRAMDRPGSPIVGSSVCLTLDDAAIFDIGWADEKVWHSPGVHAVTMLAVLCARIELLWGSGPRIHLPGWSSRLQDEGSVSVQFKKSVCKSTWQRMRAPLRRVLAAPRPRSIDDNVIEMRPHLTMKKINRGFKRWSCGQALEIFRARRM